MICNKTLEGTVNRQVQLKDILCSLTDKGFEHLCAAIMTANGLDQIKVTDKSGDKGIDGLGLVYLDEPGCSPYGWPGSASAKPVVRR